MKAPMKLQNSPMAQRRLAPESAGGAEGGRRVEAANGAGAAGDTGSSGGGAGKCLPAVAAGGGGDVPGAEGLEDIGSVRRTGRAPAGRRGGGGWRRAGSGGHGGHRDRAPYRPRAGGPARGRRPAPREPGPEALGSSAAAPPVACRGTPAGRPRLPPSPVAAPRLGGAPSALK